MEFTSAYTHVSDIMVGLEESEEELNRKIFFPAVGSVNGDGWAGSQSHLAMFLMDSTMTLGSEKDGTTHCEARG
jgi:hypothetical protein